MNEKTPSLSPPWRLMGMSVVLLFLSSSLRHGLYHSTAWDLGIFDQAIYLISQGKPPISSFLETHILGDHSALIFYPLALFYKIYPSVYWLFLIQAIALTSGAFFIHQLARHEELKPALAKSLSLVYLLYPLIFNVNLFDFHTDVIALAGLFWAIWSVKTQRLLSFLVALLLVASCKGVLGLTIAAMGLWLLTLGKKREGSIALIGGITWFWIASKVIIPYFTQNSQSIDRHLSRFSYLGHSYPEILQNMIFKPWLILGGLFNATNFGYLCLLILPLAWGLVPKILVFSPTKKLGINPNFMESNYLPLIATLPTLLMNLLASDEGQKDLLHQYSLPILPFLFVIVIDNLKSQQTWLMRPRWLMLWALVSFVALAKLEYFPKRYFATWNTWSATNTAIAEIKTQGGVLTSAEMAPHLTHRPLVKLAVNGSENLDLDQFEYVLINLRYPGWESSPQLLMTFIRKLEDSTDFQIKFQQDGVVLFYKRPNLRLG